MTKTMAKQNTCSTCDHSLNDHINNEDYVCTIEHYGSVCLCDHYKATFKVLINFDVELLTKAFKQLSTVVENLAETFNQIPDLVINDWKHQ